MKNIAAVLLSAFLITCTEKKTETVNTGNSTVISDKDREIDSMKSVIEAQNNPQQESLKEEETIDSENTEKGTEPIDENKTLQNLSGKHALTLQWIGWGKPGTIHFKKTGENTYTVSGSQKEGTNYLKVEGKMVQVSNEELQFEGTLETFVESNGGKCLRTGPQTFLVTKNRKYWRMQNMVECFGLTDYVDIYF